MQKTLEVALGRQMVGAPCEEGGRPPVELARAEA